jgi:hypothetical protein
MLAVPPVTPYMLLYEVLRIPNFDPSSLEASSLSMGIIYMTFPMFRW